MKWHSWMNYRCRHIGNPAKHIGFSPSHDEKTIPGIIQIISVIIYFSPGIILPMSSLAQTDFGKGTAEGTLCHYIYGCYSHVHSPTLRLIVNLHVKGENLIKHHRNTLAHTAVKDVNAENGKLTLRVWGGKMGHCNLGSEPLACIWETRLGSGVCSGLNVG